MKHLRSLGWMSGLVFLTSACAAEGQLNHQSGKSQVSFTVRKDEGTGDNSTQLSRARLIEGTCDGYNLIPDTRQLSVQALKNHLKAKGIEHTVRTERQDLHLFDLKIGGTTARLRVATLDTPREAGRHLHKALLEHGGGFWGVHRSNLAVLGPDASTQNALAFASDTGLVCWGVFTAANRDDTFTVPGGYFEL